MTLYSLCDRCGAEIIHDSRRVKEPKGLKVEAFVRDCVDNTCANADFVKNEDLFCAFLLWAEDNSFDVSDWTPTRLTQKMKKLGFVQTTKSLFVDGREKRISKKVWLGIKIGWND